MDEEFLQHLLKQLEDKSNNHCFRIELIETKQAETNIRIDNLCKSIEGLTSTIKWFICLCITSLLGFFMYMIQNNLIK